MSNTATVNGSNGLCFKQWSPNKILDLSLEKYAIVILNQPIMIETDFMYNLWETASLRLTVDGGTDRWFDWIKNNCGTLPRKPSYPDYVTGDFDSITKQTMEFVKNQSSIQIVHTPDQDATDFTKALKHIAKLTENGLIDINAVLVTLETSGRLDQILSSLSTLCLAQTFLKSDVYLLASNSLSWLLKPNTLHSISIPDHLHTNQMWCSLAPLKGRTDGVSTTGLKWNLNNGILDFGEMVSTSNTYGSSGESEVTVKTSNDLLWSMGLIKD